MRTIESQKEVWRITERRGGAVFRTEFVERRWVELPLLDQPPDNDPDLMWVTISDPNVHVMRVAN